jgi:hypothetical protein
VAAKENPFGLAVSKPKKKVKGNHQHLARYYFKKGAPGRPKGSKNKATELEKALFGGDRLAKQAIFDLLDQRENLDVKLKAWELWMKYRHGPPRTRPADEVEADETLDFTAEVDQETIKRLQAIAGGSSGNGKDERDEPKAIDGGEAGDMATSDGGDGGAGRAAEPDGTPVPEVGPGDNLDGDGP